MSADSQRAPHERHRDFTKWIGEAHPEWALDRRVDPPADIDMMSSFFLYKHTS